MSDRDRSTRIAPTMFALLVGALITQFEITVVSTAMPAISAELHDHALYPWVFAGYLVAYTAAVPTFGMINDSIGRRQAYLIAMALLAGGSIVCALATSMESLIAGRLIQGAGAGAVYVSAQTIMGDLFTIELRAKMQGYMSLTMGIGTASGPLLGGLFVTHASWRWAFLLTLPIAAAATILLLIGYAPGPRSPNAPKTNWPGALMLTLVLCALFTSFERTSVNLPRLALAVAIAIPFLWLERRATRPILPPDLFRDRAFIVAALTLMLLSAIQIGSMVFMPLYLQGVLGLSPTTAGYLMTVPVTVFGAVATFSVGRVIKRRGFHTAVRIGAGLLVVKVGCLAAAAWLQVADPDALAPLVLLIVSQAALGASIGMTVTAAMICVQNQVVKERRGTATASLHLMRGVALLLTPAAFGAIYLAAVAGQGLGLDPEQFLNQKVIATLDPALLASSRAGMGEALRTLLWPLIALGVLAFAMSLLFPKAVSLKEAR